MRGLDTDTRKKREGKRERERESSTNRLNVAESHWQSSRDRADYN